MTDSDRGSERALPLAEAAARLGLTTDALRMRIRRGKARGFKRAGQVYVWLDARPAGPLSKDLVRGPAPPRPGPALGPSGRVEPEPWSALAAHQREEIARLIRETERLNLRLDRHLEEVREMRQMLQREQVLRQQEQSLRRDVQRVLDRLIAHPVLAPGPQGVAVAPESALAAESPVAPAVAPAVTPDPNQDLADMLKEIGQSLRELEAHTADGQHSDPAKT